MTAVKFVIVAVFASLTTLFSLRSFEKHFRNKRLTTREHRTIERIYAENFSDKYTNFDQFNSAWLLIANALQINPAQMLPSDKIIDYANDIKFLRGFPGNGIEILENMVLDKTSKLKHNTQTMLSTIHDIVDVLLTN